MSGSLSKGWSGPIDLTCVGETLGIALSPDRGDGCAEPLPRLGRPVLCGGGGAVGSACQTTLGATGFGFGTGASSSSSTTRSNTLRLPQWCKYTWPSRPYSGPSSSQSGPMSGTSTSSFGGGGGGRGGSCGSFGSSIAIGSDTLGVDSWHDRSVSLQLLPRRSNLLGVSAAAPVSPVALEELGELASLLGVPGAQAFFRVSSLGAAELAPSLPPFSPFGAALLSAIFPLALFPLTLRIIGIPSLSLPAPPNRSETLKGVKPDPSVICVALRGGVTGPSFAGVDIPCGSRGLIGLAALAVVVPVARRSWTLLMSSVLSFMPSAKEAEWEILPLTKDIETTLVGSVRYMVPSSVAVPVEETCFLRLVLSSCVDIRFCLSSPLSALGPLNMGGSHRLAASVGGGTVPVAWGIAGYAGAVGGRIVIGGCAGCAGISGSG